MKRLLLALLFCSPAFAGYSQYWTIVAPANPTADTLASGTYTSGITAVGTTSQTCTLTLFNGGGSGATATVALTGTNAIAGGTALVITAAGTGYTSAPTSATAGSGTATCTGTATVSTVVTGVDLTNYPVLIDNTRYAALGTAFKTTGNGGLLTSSSGYDHVYTTTPPTGSAGNYSCTVNMDWDSEVYAANGPFVDHVLLATLSHTITKTFYACAGNSSITTFQGNVIATWAAYANVIHAVESSNPYADSLSCTGCGSYASTNPTQLTSGCNFGYCQSFVAGSSQYIAFSYASGASFGTTIAQSLWFKSSTTPPNVFNILYAGYNTNANGSFFDFVQTTGHVRAYCNNSGYISSSVAYNDGNWHIMDQLEVAGAVSLYIDGALIGSAGTCATGTGNVGFSLAATLTSSPANFVTAVMQEVRIAPSGSSALTSSWVAADYNSQKPSSTFLTVTAALGFVANPFVIVVN